MTDMLVRPLADNRMLRASGGADLTVSLGQSLGAVFDTPMMTGLVGQSWGQSDAGLEGFTEQQRLDLRQSEFDRQQEASNLEAELDWSTDDRRDEITLRLGELSSERNIQIQTETQRSLDEGRLQEPESLNELYGELDLKFDRPMTAGEASLLADNKRAETIRQSIISKGPAGILPGVAKFGAGLAAMAVDPLEVASMFIPVVGVGGRVAATARFGKVGGRVLVGATEGFVGSALTEPIYFGLSRQQQLDYTMTDALLNVGLGTIFGGGISAIGGVLARADAPAAARVDGEPVRVDMPDAVRAVPEPVPVRVDIDPIAARVARVEADTSIRQFVNDQIVDVDLARAPQAPASVEPIIDVDGRVFNTAVPEKILVDTKVANGPVVKDATAAKLADDYVEAIPKIEAEPRPTGSWVAVNRKTGESVFETFSESTAAKINSELYSVIPAEDYLPRLNRRIKETGNAKLTPEDAAELHSAGISRETLAVKQESASRLADHAEDIEADPLVNTEASKRYDEPISETFMDDDIEVGDAVIKQMEDAGELTPEQKTMIAEVKEMEAHAKAYADVTEAAAICMGRT